jgi:hypothetical protein
LQCTMFADYILVKREYMASVGRIEMSKKTNKTKVSATLEANDCRWPIGDPRDADFHFCGAQQMAGRPYCSHHWQISYVPNRPRQYGGAKALPTVVLALPARRAA